MTTTTRALGALEQAGREIVREAYKATGVVPNYLAGAIGLPGDIDHLDEVAREHGLEDGMPNGHQQPQAPEWKAVFEGVRRALAEIAGADLSRDAREILDEMGISVHRVEDGTVHMGDEKGGAYDPASVERVEAACEAVADASRFHGDEDRTATAYRFEAFHDALGGDR